MACELGVSSADVPLGLRPSAARQAIHAVYRRHWHRRGLRRLLDLIPPTDAAGVAEVRVWGGGHLTFPRQGAGITAALWRLGAYEALETTLVSRLATGRVFYDVGANVGYYTVIASSVGARRVVAVEPFVGSLAYLHANIARNGLQGVTVLEMAAGSSEGIAPLYDGLGFGISSLSLTTAVSTNVAAMVRVSSLDAVLEQQGLPDPDLLKIDAEGSEGAVITGFARTIRRSHPVILIELNERLLRAAGTSARLVLDQLRNLGYDRVLDIGGRRAQRIDPDRTSDAIAYTQEMTPQIEPFLGC
jgi:FkbM family methyltransferase